MSLRAEHFSPFAVDTPRLLIQGLGVGQTMPPCILDRPQGWPHYLLILFYDPVLCQTEQGPQTIAPGNLILWEPGVPQNFGDSKKPWNHSWFSCSGSVVEEVIHSLGFTCNKPLQIHETEFVDVNLTEIYSELKRPGDVDLAMVENLITNLFRRAARACRPPIVSNAIPERLLMLRNYIELNFSKPLVLENLARQAGLSVSHLCLQYKRHFGHSVMAHLREVRLNYSKLLLRDTTLKVSEVAEEVGYTDVYHFSKSYKQQFNTTPRGLGKRA